MGTRESDDSVGLLEAETVVDLTPHGTMNSAILAVVPSERDSAHEAPTAPESPVSSHPEEGPSTALEQLTLAKVPVADLTPPPTGAHPPPPNHASAPTAGAPWLTRRAAGPQPPAPQPDDAPWTCPRTQRLLEAHYVAGLHFHVNPDTGGMMMEKASFEFMRTHPELWNAVDDATARWAANAFQQVDLTSVVYINCPRCSGPMLRRNFEKVSGVIVDECQLHGIWLDAGEMNRILEFLDGSGMQRRAQFEAQEAAILEKQQEQIRRISARSFRSNQLGWDAGDID